MRDPIVISWEEWQASREIKRRNLAKFGLDGSSRRQTDYGTAGARLRRAFSGKRAPEFNTQQIDER